MHDRRILHFGWVHLTNLMVFSVLAGAKYKSGDGLFIVGEISSLTDSKGFFTSTFVTNTWGSKEGVRRGWVVWSSLIIVTAAGLSQSVERLIAEREVAGSIPGTGTILRVLKQLRNEGTAFTLQMVRPSRGSDDHVKWRSCLH